MEIIHVVLGKANPDRLNGVNKVVFNLATEQANAGKRVQVWGITPNPVHDYPARNFKTVLFQQQRFPFSMPAELKTAILEKASAVFHIHGGWVPIFSTIARFMRKNRVKYVITPHGAYNEVAMQRSGFRKKVYFQLFEKSLLNHAHKVHLIGCSEVDGLLKICPKATPFLLPYGFNAPKSPIATSKNSDFTIGFVGRLDTHTKGLDLLLQAFEIFQKQHPISKLWIIGNGPGKSFLENFIQKNQLENAVLLGEKFGAEKDELISKMHVFAHPSRNEGLPTAVLEAAALGTPVVVTQATNVADYVSAFGAGIAIDNNNTEQLVEAMNTMYQHYQTSDADAFAAAGRKMLDEVFSWHKLVDKYDELYK